MARTLTSQNGPLGPKRPFYFYCACLNPGIVLNLCQDSPLTSTPDKDNQVTNISQLEGGLKKYKNTTRKRRTESNVSGRQRGILAWERDVNKGFLHQSVVFGGEG